MTWNPIETVPYNTPVLVFVEEYHGRKLILKTKYISSFTVECGANRSDCVDYCKITSRKFYSEGFYEIVDTLSILIPIQFDGSNEPSHWTEIPSFPVGA